MSRCLALRVRVASRACVWRRGDGKRGLNDQAGWRKITIESTQLPTFLSRQKLLIFTRCAWLRWPVVRYGGCGNFLLLSSTMQAAQSQAECASFAGYCWLSQAPRSLYRVRTLQRERSPRESRRERAPRRRHQRIWKRRYRRV